MLKVSLSDIFSTLEKYQNEKGLSTKKTTDGYGKLDEDSIMHNAALFVHATRIYFEHYLAQRPGIIVTEIDMNMSVSSSVEGMDGFFEDDSTPAVAATAAAATAAAEAATIPCAEDNYRGASVPIQYHYFLQTMPPNFDRDPARTQAQRRKRKKMREALHDLKVLDPLVGVEDSDKEDDIDDNDDDNNVDGEGDELLQNVRAANYRCWTVEPRSRNPLLAPATAGVIRIMSELFPNLHTLRMAQWSLCQHCWALLVHPLCFPHLRRLCLAGAKFLNEFKTLGQQSRPFTETETETETCARKEKGCGHPSLVELNLCGILSAHETGSDKCRDPSQAVLVSYLPALQRLYLCNVWVQLHDSFLESLAENCHDLRSFVASPECEGPTEEGLDFTDSGLLALIRGCPKLEVLSVSVDYGPAVSLAIASRLPFLRWFAESTSTKLRKQQPLLRVHNRAEEEEEEVLVTLESSRGESPLELLELNCGPLLLPINFSRLASFSLLPSMRLRSLVIGDLPPPSDGKSAEEFKGLGELLTKALHYMGNNGRLKMLQVLQLPVYVTVEKAVLALLAAGCLPSLRSWTSTLKSRRNSSSQNVSGTAAAAAGSIDSRERVQMCYTSSPLTRGTAGTAGEGGEGEEECAWQIDVLESIAACNSSTTTTNYIASSITTAAGRSITVIALEHIVVGGGVTLTPQFLRSLSRAFPRLRILELTDYYLTTDQKQQQQQQQMTGLPHVWDIGEMLSVFLLEFPCLNRIVLPKNCRSNVVPHQQPPPPKRAPGVVCGFDWLSFALLRAVVEEESGQQQSNTSLPCPRVLHPLPAILSAVSYTSMAAAAAAAETTHGKNVPAWVDELRSHCATCALPKRIQVHLFSPYDSTDIPPDILLSRLCGRKDPSSFEKMFRGIPFREYPDNDHAPKFWAQREFLTASLSGSAPSIHGMFLLGEPIPLSESMNSTGSCAPARDASAVSAAEDLLLTAGEDSDNDNDDNDDNDDDDVKNVEIKVGTSTAKINEQKPQCPRQNALGVFRSVLRRLRRGSTRISTIVLPHVLNSNDRRTKSGPSSAVRQCASRGESVVDDSSFQLDDISVAACLLASLESKTITELTVVVEDRNQVMPDSRLLPALLKASVEGLVRAAPTWSNLSVVNISMLESRDIVRVFDALSSVYESPGSLLGEKNGNTTCKDRDRSTTQPHLHTVTVSTADSISPALVIATARLTVAVSATLMKIEVKPQTHCKLKDSASVVESYTSDSIQAVRSMVQALKPNYRDPRARLSFHCAGEFVGVYSVLHQIVTGGSSSSSSSLRLSRPLLLDMVPLEKRNTSSSSCQLTSELGTTSTVLMDLLDAFIDNNGLLQYGSTVLGLNLEATDADSSVTASFLARQRARKPHPYGLLHPDEELQWMARSFAVSTQRDARDNVSPLPCKYFLTASNAEGDAAFDRIMQVVIPVYRKCNETHPARKTVGHLRDSVGPLGANETFVYDGVFPADTKLTAIAGLLRGVDRKSTVFTSADMLQQSISPITTTVGSPSSGAVAADHLQSGKKEALLLPMSSACFGGLELTQHVFLVQNHIKKCHNVPDMLFGGVIAGNCNRGASVDPVKRNTPSPLVSVLTYHTREAALAKEWKSRGRRPVNGAAPNALGPLFVGRISAFNQYNDKDKDKYNSSSNSNSSFVDHSNELKVTIDSAFQVHDCRSLAALDYVKEQQEKLSVQEREEQQEMIRNPRDFLGSNVNGGTDGVVIDTAPKPVVGTDLITRGEWIVAGYDYRPANLQSHNHPASNGNSRNSGSSCSNSNSNSSNDNNGSGSSSTISIDNNSRVLLWRSAPHCDVSVCRIVDGTELFTLGLPVAATAKAKPTATVVPPVQYCMIIDGVCLMTWQNQLLVYDLWLAEQQLQQQKQKHARSASAAFTSGTNIASAAAGTNEFNDCSFVAPIASCAVSGAMFGWCGDQYVFAGGGNNLDIAILQLNTTLIATRRAEFCRDESSSSSNSSTVTASVLNNCEQIIRLQNDCGPLGGTTHVTAIRCTTALIAVATLRTVQLFRRPAASASGAEQQYEPIRLVPCQSMGIASLIPSSVLGHSFVSGDVIAYTERPRLHGRKNGDPLQCSSIVVEEALTGAVLLRVKGIQANSQDISFSVWGEGMLSLSTPGLLRLLQITDRSLLHKGKALLTESSMLDPHTTTSKPASAVYFKISDYIVPIAGPLTKTWAKTVAVLRNISKQRKEKDAMKGQRKKKGVDKNTEVLSDGGVALIMETMGEEAKAISGLEAPHKLWAEGFVYSVYTCCMEHNAELAILLLNHYIKLLQNSISTDDANTNASFITSSSSSYPVPVTPTLPWLLKCELDFLHHVHPSTYAMEEDVVSSASDDLRAAIEAFYDTAMGAVLCKYPEVALRALQAGGFVSRNNGTGTSTGSYSDSSSSSSTSGSSTGRNRSGDDGDGGGDPSLPWVVGLLAVVGSAFSTVGMNWFSTDYMFSVPASSNSDATSAHKPPFDSECKVFTALLQQCSKESLLSLGKDTLKGIADRIANKTELNTGFVALEERLNTMVKQIDENRLFDQWNKLSSALTASAGASAAVVDADAAQQKEKAIQHEEKNKEAEARMALAAWEQYQELVNKIQVFLGIILAPRKFDEITAETALLSIEEHLHHVGVGGVVLSDHMHRVLRIRGPCLEKALQAQSMDTREYSEFISSYVVSTYTTTLLGAACGGNRQDDVHSEQYELYLALRSRLIVGLLEAGAGTDINAASLPPRIPRLTPYGSKIPSLPIDLLLSPALLHTLLDACNRLSVSLDLTHSHLLCRLVDNHTTGCLVIETRSTTSNAAAAAAASHVAASASSSSLLTPITETVEELATATREGPFEQRYALLERLLRERRFQRSAVKAALTAAIRKRSEDEQAMQRQASDVDYLKTQPHNSYTQNQIKEAEAVLLKLRHALRYEGFAVDALSKHLLTIEG